MIIFYADNFELNLTNLNITFVEENAMFYDAFFKNYTPPFTLDIDEETSEKMGLIDLDNSSNYKTKYYGRLFLDYHFVEAYLLIEVIQEKIEGTLYFGKTTIPLFDTPLPSLPFPVINTTSINAWAKSVITKNYPEVSHNFPMVFDDEFKKETDYEAFEGIVNNFNAYDFVPNEIEVGTNAVLNKNIMVPFPYLMEILKVGFESSGRTITGDFVNDKANNHILIDPKKHLEKFSTTTYENYQLKTKTDEYLEGSKLLYEFSKSHTLNLIGSFEIKAFLNFPKSIIVKELKIKRGNEVVFTGVGNAIDESVNFNKEEASPAETVTVIIIIEATQESIEFYNNFEFQKTDVKLNEFKNSFSLAEFMPEMTFGTLLSKLKNWLNLEVILGDTTVAINYIETSFTKVNFKDETAFQQKYPKREFNQSKLYKLLYTENNYLIIDKTGRINSIVGYREEDIIKIDMDLQILPVENRGLIFSAVRQNNDVFSMLLYNKPDLNGYPVASDKVEGLTFKLPEVHNLRWKNWLQFRLNAETYTDKFEAHTLEEFLINEGRFKYNKKHIYKKISRTRKSETEWDVDIESESF